MITKTHRWKKRIGVSVLLLLGAIAIAVAALPDLRQGLALLWAYNANSYAPDEWQAADASASIPFLYDRHILVPATVQGDRVVTIALDTGAPMSALIGGPHLDGVELDTGRTVPIGGSGQGVTPTAQLVSDLRLTVGAVAFSDFTALLIPWEQMGGYFNSPEQVYIHGILGYDLFSRYVVEFDFDRELLTLHRPDEFDYAGNGEIIPLTYVQRKPYFEAVVTQFDGTRAPVKLQLDLGKPTPLSLIPSEHDNISVPPHALEGESRGLSGQAEERVSRIRELRIGNQVLHDVVTAFSVEGHSTTGERNGVLGVEVLARFRVFIDYARDRMILEPIALDKTFESDMSGITWVPQGDSYAIWQLRDDSPARIAGLQEGDELVTIDGVHATSVRFGELFERMRSGDGVEIALKLRRGAQLVSVVMTLRRRI